jgi:peptidoglycan/LPS O-acetylase OafA/YrhL
MSGADVKPSVNAYWGASYFAPLDGLRAVSVILVVAYHVMPIGDGVTLKRFVQGHLGVDIFFVLSGFLITTLLIREWRSAGAISIRAFYVRRAFRIAPVYCIAILAYLAIGLIPSQHQILTRTLAALPYYLSFRNEYVPMNLDVTLGHSWSLSVEEKFYFVWPVLFALMAPRPAARWLALPLLGLLYIVVPDYLLLTSYASILLGCGLALLMEAGRSRQEQIVEAINAVPTWLIVVLGIGSYLVALEYYGSLKFVFSIYVAALIPFLLVKTSLLSAFLGSSVMTWIGKRTYAMYLLHRIGSNFVEHYVIVPRGNVSYLAAVALAYLVAIGAAEITYVLVERPMTGIGRIISKRIVA